MRGVSCGLCIPDCGLFLYGCCEFVKLNEIRQRRKLVDRALCCVCRAINEYAQGRTTMGSRALPLTTGRAWKRLEFFTVAL